MDSFGLLFILILGRILTVEDHYPEGGIAEAVASELLTNVPNHQFNFKRLCVNSVPYSGQPNELLESLIYNFF